MSDMKNHHLKTCIVTSRKCPTCGHHEVGYETDNGTFVPLRPGDSIGVFRKSEVPDVAPDICKYPQATIEESGLDPKQFVPWVPEPLRCDRTFCRKYGVLVNSTVMKGEMTPPLYEMAYRQKLQGLIEKEVHTPLSVILDRFFVAPHLAYGNAKQAADALWEELDEIRDPVTWMTQWLQSKDEPSFLRLIHPKTKEDLKGEMVSDDQLREELSRMSLEAFFEAL